MAKRIRVLFAVGSMGGGGSERQMIGMLRHFDRSVFEPLLYLVYREGDLLNEIPDDVPVFSFWDEHKQPRLRIPGQIHHWQVRHFQQVLQEQHVDAICDRTYFMTMIAGPASRRTGTPRISFIDCDPELDLSKTAGQFVWIKRRLLRRAYMDAAKTVAVADGVRNNAIAYYQLPTDRVQTIFNATDVDRIDRLASEAGQRDDSVFRIICAGRLHEQKGYPYLIDAVADLVHGRQQAQLRLDILGVGPEEERLREMVREKRLHEHVQFLGFRDNPYRLFRESHLFCLPSLYEGMPTVLLDAVACRIPVLATDCESGPREVLDQGKHGTLVPTRNSKALADAIEDAIGDYETWTERTNAARVYLEQTFAVPVVVARIESLLKSVCEG